jgi:hypothetical protein
VLVDVLRQDEGCSVPMPLMGLLIDDMRVE